MIPERWLNLGVLTLLAAVPLVASLAGQPFTVTLATKIAIFALAATGLNIALGLGGLVSFGHAAFFGVGGYACGILASHARNYEPLSTWPWDIEGTTQMLTIWPIAVLLGGLAALVIGALSLRTSGIFFIMITLAFAQMLYYFAISWPTYGGEDGLPFYLRGDFPGLNTMDPIQFFGICFALLLAALFTFHRLHRARFGLSLEAARQNPERLRSLGIRPFHVRLLAFVISGMITALAGALYADLNRFVSPAMLSWHLSGELIVLIVLGGVGRLCGPVVGAAAYFLLEHWAGAASEYWQFWFGLLLLGVVLFARGGIVGALAKDHTHD
ncbi:amino acid/amide ABC transporter membrane protein 2 (HAAT family) [Aliiruegeria haliotis]|uniref:Amino acid/amide ABC transporter membrane protein 2 (HAAT family) n=1 Tax=Aliiruegeria haliotis TaxID=1280846 RepID=A0A2T0RW05_9RHOB|nr:branched-chain amino acid ABC transporter permease [Aliiruegeria haliotis]PRY25312.1 amino acid/amide ABC transporter membrane protein 2 (HAAT family) [Aliiruegeria haliotis]